MTPADSPRFAEHRVERAGTADADVLTRVIASAFFSLAVSRWLVPDPDARQAIFPGYFRLLVEHALEDGLAETTPDRAAAALWIPRTGPDTPPGGYAGQLAAITGRYVGNFLAFDEALDHHHPVDVPHEHLAILAVRPDRQGRGIGTALLHARHVVLDDQRMPAYLEASDQRTRGLYLDHGYTDQGSPIEFADGVRMYPMWRQPHQGSRM